MNWSLYNYDNTPSFSLKGINTTARVVNIHDGDTFTAIIPLFSTFYKFTIRIDSIDTPEVSSKNTTIQSLAQKAKLKLFSLITSSSYIPSSDKDLKTFLNNSVYLVYLQCQDFDKYGRLLADVQKDPSSPSFASVLIQQKLAYPYDGGKKLNEDDIIPLLTK